MKVRGIVIANVLFLWMGGTLVAQAPAASADSRVFVDGALGADYDQTDFESPGPAMARGFRHRRAAVEAVQPAIRIRFPRRSSGPVRV